MSNSRVFPFAAIVGQEELKPALILNIIDPGIGGVLIKGEKGTAKTTAVRGLADILPLIQVIKNCPFQLPLRDTTTFCGDCILQSCMEGLPDGMEPEVLQAKVKLVELPLGATEDRLVGTLNLEHALKKGEKRFEPGILAQANRGILYVDEVNLLDDHLVDVLLDSAAMGVNTVERAGVSFSHPARFTLIGTMNPEEGELRPQLLDRFGLCITIQGIKDITARVSITTRRLEFERDPGGFHQQWSDESALISLRILEARKLFPEISPDPAILEKIAAACVKLGVDGHRGDITTFKAARALAAYDGRSSITADDLMVAAQAALSHRMKNSSLDHDGSQVRSEIRKAIS